MSQSVTLDSATGGHTPDWRLSVDGVDITGNIAHRLMSLTLTDNRGFEADPLDIELDDSDRRLLLPRRGASVALSLGWKETGLINKGSFTVDEIEHSGTSDRLTIRARSANFRASLNVQREASWHNATLGDVVKTLTVATPIPAWWRTGSIPARPNPRRSASDANGKNRPPTKKSKVIIW